MKDVLFDVDSIFREPVDLNFNFAIFMLVDGNIEHLCTFYLVFYTSMSQRLPSTPLFSWNEYRV